MNWQWSATAAMAMAMGVMLNGCAGQRPIESIRESGDFKFTLGHYAAAADEYQEIADRHPGDWPAQYRLGQCRLRTSEYQQARRALEIAYSHRPNDEAIALTLAESMFQLGDENELYAFLRQRAAQTQSTRVHMEMSRYAAALGDNDTAKTAIETAIQLDNGLSVEPYLQAASQAQAIGDIELAVLRLRQAYGIDMQNELVKQRLRELGEIPGPTIALEPGR